MFDRKYFKDLSNKTVKELIETLKDYPQDAQISVLGDSNFFIHMEEDKSIVIFDDNSMEDEYKD